MAAGEAVREVGAPIEAVWRFTSDMDNWAPLVTGYQSHERVSEHESLWTLKGQVGQLSKAVTFRVRITEWRAAKSRSRWKNEHSQGGPLARPAEAPDHDAVRSAVSGVPAHRNGCCSPCAQSATSFAGPSGASRVHRAGVARCGTPKRGGRP